jgi:hypothetical protein
VFGRALWAPASDVVTIEHNPPYLHIPTMAAVGDDDAQALKKRVWGFVKDAQLTELAALLEGHPEVDVDGCKDGRGWRALFCACHNGHTECARLLIDHKADVNAKNNDGRSALYTAAQCKRMSCMELLVQNGADVNCQTNTGFTPLMTSTICGYLTGAQYLLEQNADVHYRVSKNVHFMNMDALYWAMTKSATDCTPGSAFAFLSCNTDAKNSRTDEYGVTATLRDTHVETYQHVQSFIDEYHSILHLVLSDHVQVDTRVGRGDYGIYQEPLERTLEYLGLSMSRDRVVNASIDGEGVTRALVPGRLLNANHWFNKHFSYNKALPSPPSKNRGCNLS